MIREVSKIKYVYELLTPRIRGDDCVGAREIEREQDTGNQGFGAEVDGCLLPYSRKSISLMITAD